MHTAPFFPTLKSNLAKLIRYKTQKSLFCSFPQEFYSSCKFTSGTLNSSYTETNDTDRSSPRGPQSLYISLATALVLALTL